MRTRCVSFVAGSTRSNVSRLSSGSHLPSNVSFSLPSGGVPISTYFFFSGEYRTSAASRNLPPLKATTIQQSSPLNFQPQEIFSSQNLSRGPGVSLVPPLPFQPPTNSCSSCNAALFLLTGAARPVATMPSSPIPSASAIVRFIASLAFVVVASRHPLDEGSAAKVPVVT